MTLEGQLQLLGALAAVTLARGLLVFLAALAATTLVKRLSAEARHLIWLGVIAGFVLIPMGWLFLPVVRTGIGIPLETTASYRLAAAPALSGGQYARMVEAAVIRAALARPALAFHAHALYRVLPLVWLTGALALGLRLALGRVRLRRLAAEARGDARLLSLARRLAGDRAGRRKLAVLRSSECAIPFTFGLLRPVILLPEGAAHWPGSRLRCVLTHELAHIRRRDIATQSFAYAVCLLFWFLPPLWLAYHALLREAETCCDQQVINRGFRGPEYARDIVSLVRGCGGRVLLPGISNAIGRKGMLKERVKKVLVLEPGRPPLGVRGVLRVLAVCLACLVPILALSAQAKTAVLPPDDPLFGTWVNEEYDQAIARGENGVSKIVIYSDGRELCYRRIADAEPIREWFQSYEETWVDAEGSHWYKINETGWMYPSRAAKSQGFWFCKVGSGGTVLEGVWAQYGYPEDVSPTGPSYGMYKRE